MKKLLLLIVILFVCFSGMATNYYVNTIGNDANNGLSPATPWKSLTKVNSFFNSFLSGDSILFNRGNIFYGNIRPTKNFITPLVFSAYGSGALPIITSFIQLDSWTNLGANIWEGTSLDSSAFITRPACNMVLINGVNVAMGRFPNENAANGGYLTYTSFTQTTLTSASLNSSTTNWSGALAVIRKNNWIIEKDTITSAAGTTITHTFHGTNNGTNNYGFFIENDARTLDVQNEWYYVPGTHRLRVFSTSAPTNVKISTIDTLVWTRQFDQMTFKNISFTGSNNNVFVVPGSNHITIKKCNFDYNGRDVVWGYQNVGAGSATAFVFDSNTVNHTNNNVVQVAQEFTNSSYSFNTIKNTGLQVGMLANGATTQSNAKSATAIQTSSANNIIEYNVIDSTGYVAIYWLNSNDTIRYNLITEALRVKQDGGLIYTWNGIPGAAFFTGVAIYNNILLNSSGLTSVAGTTQTATTSLVHGIYLDANTRFVRVYNNTAAFLGWGGGYSYSGSSNNYWHDNTFYNNSVNQWRLIDQRPSSNGSVPSTNDTIKNNIFFSRAATQLTGVFTTATTPTLFFGAVGVFDSNYYARPIDDNITIQFTWGTGSVNNTLAQWKTTSAKDAASNKCPVVITNVNQLDFEYNATNAAVIKPLAAGVWIDVKGVFYNTGSITLAPFTSAVLINTGANIPPVANAGTNKNITLPTSSVTQVGSGTDADGTVVAYLWTLFSGPASVSFGSPTNATTTVNGMTAPGTYVVQLKVTDNFGLTATDTASIVVNAVIPPNLPPVVNAGGNKVIVLPVSTVTQNGSATDPDGTIASYIWTQSASNPSVATIVSPTNPITVINNLSVTGTYSFTLTATDNLGLTGSQTITVIVNPAIPIAPTANAGSDQIITYPVTSISLAGSGSDPDGVIVSYNWQKISGGTASITNQNSASTTVTGIVPGIYQFQLTVTDNSGLTGKDTMQVTSNQGASSISFSPSTLTKTWTNLPQQPTVITTPAGLSYNITFNNVGAAPVDTGTYVTRAATTDPNYVSSLVTANFRINPAPASIAINNAVQQYDSTLKFIGVTTTPPGLPVIITGSPQRYKGTYAVHVELNDPNHTATAIDTTLTITAGQTTVSWTPADLTYPTPTGAAQTNAVFGKPGVATYIPPSNTVINSGIQALQVDYVPLDTNIAPIIGTVRDITVHKGTTSIVVSDTIQDFDGAVKNITAIAGQSGTVSVSYTGTHTAPGDYPFTASFASANWTAPTVTGTLHILPNFANINITNFSNRVYTSGGISPTVTTLYSYSLTFDGSPVLPINVNPHIIVIATITDGIHTGADTVVMNIIKANPGYTWPAIAPMNYPTPLSSTQLNVASSVPSVITYNPASGFTLPGGTNIISATVTPTDGANYNTIVVTNTVIVNTGTAVINVINTPQTYNGLPHPIIASTVPPNLDSLDIVYGTSHTPPTNAGSYQFTVRLINPNIVATPVSGTLVISKGTYAVSWTPPMPIQAGSLITPSILNATSTIPGFFTYNYALNTIMNTVGTFALQATFHPSNNVNYDTQTITVSLTVFGDPFLLYYITRGGTFYDNYPGQTLPNQ